MDRVELIYTRTRYKGLSSPELALEEKRLTICYLSGLDICDYLYGCLGGLLDRKSALDHEYAK